MVWQGWPLSRVLILFVGLAFLLVTVQVTLYHYRQNFRHWAQWVPVLGVPVFGVAALAAALINQLWLIDVLVILLGIGLAAGVFGFVLHVAGIRERVGGYDFNNFMVGPPIILPLILVAAISLLGLLVIFWR